MAKKKKEKPAAKSEKKKDQPKTSVKKDAQKSGLEKAAPKNVAAGKSELKPAKQVKAAPVQAVAPKNPPSQPMTTGTGKKRLMVSYEKLPDEVMEVIRTKYPYGYNHDLKEVKGIDNKKFFVLPIELPDVIYLVKVDLRKPIKIQDSEDEEDIFTPEEEFAAEEDNFPAEDLEQMEGEDEGGEEEPKKKKKRDEDGDDDE